MLRIDRKSTLPRYALQRHQPVGASKVKSAAQFLEDESGATAIEYGLSAALIAVGIIVAATTLGGSLSGLFNRISTKLDAAT